MGWLDFTAPDDFNCAPRPFVADLHSVTISVSTEAIPCSAPLLRRSIENH
jgi:hypothetical protein